MTIFWDMARVVLQKKTDVSEGHTASINITLMIEAVSISETSINFYETTRRNIPKRTSS
jgi:hypothetical protein